MIEHVAQGPLPCMLLGLLVVAAAAAQAPPEDLPLEEQQLADTVDPWGLAFSDQLARFAAHFEPRPEARFAVGITHDLIKVWPVKYWYTGAAAPSRPRGAAAPVEEAERWALAGETQSLQVVVLPRTGSPAATYQVSVELHGADGDRVRVYREVFVRTAKPAYPRFESDRWPDPLLPETEATISGLDCAVFWVDVQLAPTAVGRTARARVTVTDGQEEGLAVVPIRVVPAGGFDPKAYPVVAWFPKHKLSPEGYRQLCALALEHHVQPADALVGLWDPAHPEAFDELRAFLSEHGQRLFQVDTPPLGSARGGPAGDPEPAEGPGDESFDSLYEHLRERDWLADTIVYSNQDEPSAEQFATMNIHFCQEVHRRYPGLRVFLASDRHPNMEQGCDIWMTDLSASGYEPERDRTLAAPVLWHYYCHLPVRWQMRAPLVMAPNMQIDNPALEQRLAVWMSHYYGAQGFFIWSGAHYTFGDDFWETLQLTDKPSGFPYAGIHNGNGFLVYPHPRDEEATVPSLRLKLLRDGLEDLCIQAALREQLERPDLDAEQRKAVHELLDPTPELFVRPHHFDRLPETLLRRREAMLRQLDALQGAGAA